VEIVPKTHQSVKTNPRDIGKFSRVKHIVANTRFSSNLYKALNHNVLKDIVNEKYAYRWSYELR